MEHEERQSETTGAQGNRKLLPALFFLFVVGGALWYIFSDAQRNALTRASLSRSGSATSSTGATSGNELSRNLPAAPILSEPLLFGKDFPKEAYGAAETNFKNLKAEIDQFPASAENWTRMGNLKKTIGDFDGAEAAWKYAVALNPGYYIPYNNLGDLYHFYLKEYSEAESNYRKVIELDPAYISGYENLHTLYRLSYQKETTKAESVLQEGLSKNPDSVRLMTLLASYYKERGRKDSARTLYAKALAEVKQQGDGTLASLIQKELDAL